MWCSKVFFFLVLFISNCVYAPQITIAPRSKVGNTNNQDFLKILACNRMAQAASASRLANQSTTGGRPLHCARGTAQDALIRLCFHVPDLTGEELNFYRQQHEHMFTQKIGELVEYGISIEESLDHIIAELDRQISELEANYQKKKSRSTKKQLYRANDENTYYYEFRKNALRALEDYNFTRYIVCTKARMYNALRSPCDLQAALDVSAVLVRNYQSRIRALVCDNERISWGISTGCLRSKTKKLYKKQIVQNNLEIEYYAQACRDLNNHARQFQSRFDAYCKDIRDLYLNFDVEKLEHLRSEIFNSMPVSKSSLGALDRVILRGQIKAACKQYDIVQEVLDLKRSELAADEKVIYESECIESKRENLENIVQIQECKIDTDSNSLDRIGTIQETLAESFQVHPNENVLDVLDRLDDVDTCDVVDDFESYRIKEGNEFQLQLDKEHVVLRERAHQYTLEIDKKSIEESESFARVESLVQQLTSCAANYNKHEYYKGACLLNDACFALLDMVGVVCKQDGWAPSNIHDCCDIYLNLANKLVLSQTSISLSDIKLLPTATPDAASRSWERSVCGAIGNAAQLCESAVHGVLNALNTDKDRVNLMEDQAYLQGKPEGIYKDAAIDTEPHKLASSIIIHGFFNSLKTLTYVAAHPQVAALGTLCAAGSALAKLGRFSALFFEDDPERFNQRISDFGNEIKADIDALGSALRGHPREFFENCVENLFLGWAGGKLLGAGGTAAQAAAKRLVENLENGYWFALAEQLAYETGSSLPEFVKTVGKQSSQSAPIASTVADRLAAAAYINKYGKNAAKTYATTCKIEHLAAFPKSESQIKHMFRVGEGHIIDTAANRKLVLEAVKKENFLLVDQWGKHWYHKILDDGSQVWVNTRNGVIQNCGKNMIPKQAHPLTGLARAEKLVNARSIKQR